MEEYSSTGKESRLFSGYPEKELINIWLISLFTPYY